MTGYRFGKQNRSSNAYLYAFRLVFPWNTSSDCLQERFPLDMAAGRNERESAAGRSEPVNLTRRLTIGRAGALAEIQGRRGQALVR
jgi:hypothetical protein